MDSRAQHFTLNTQSKREHKTFITLCIWPLANSSSIIMNTASAANRISVVDHNVYVVSCCVCLIQKEKKRHNRQYKSTILSHSCLLTCIDECSHNWLWCSLVAFSCTCYRKDVLIWERMGGENYEKDKKKYSQSYHFNASCSLHYMTWLHCSCTTGWGITCKMSTIS